MEKVMALALGRDGKVASQVLLRTNANSHL
jgi:hypothetical protein